MTGWAKINNVQYYFLKSGEMAKGFVEIEARYTILMMTTVTWPQAGRTLTEKVLFSESGAVHKGWMELERSIIILMKLQGLRSGLCGDRR